MAVKCLRLGRCAPCRLRGLGRLRLLAALAFRCAPASPAAPRGGKSPPPSASPCGRPFHGRARAAERVAGLSGVILHRVRLGLRPTGHPATMKLSLAAQSALLPLPSRVPLAGPRHGLRPQHNAGPFAWRLRFGPAFVSAPRPGLCPGPRASPSQPQRRPGSLTLLLGRLLWSLTLKYQIKGRIESLALAWRARGTSQGQTRRLRPK